MKKRILSIILAVSMLLTLGIPTMAEGAVATLTTSAYAYHTEDGEVVLDSALSSVDAGAGFAIVIQFTNNSSSALWINNADLYLEYDKTVISGDTFFYDDEDFGPIIGGGDFLAVQGNVTETLFKMNGADSAGKKVSAGTTMDIGYFLMKVDSGAESGTLTFSYNEDSLIKGDSKKNTTSAAPFSGLSLDGVVTLAINGVTPTINTVSLGSTASVTVSGGTSEAQTVQASAASAKGTNITGNVTWSVTPADKGVTVGETGLISVDPKAAAGKYTVKASAIEGKTQGEAKSATLTVSRAAAAVDAVAITGEDDSVSVPGTGAAANTISFSASITDQFGDAMTAKSAVWTVTDSDDQPVEGVTINAGVVSVAAAAKSAITDTTGKTLKVTASCEGKSDVREITVKRDTAAVNSVEISGDDSAAVPVVSASPADYDYTAKVFDQYEDEMSGQTLSWSVSSATGVTMSNGKLSVTNLAGAGSVTVKAVCGSVEGTKNVSITKAESVATTVEIQSGASEMIVPTGADNTETYTAKVYDQFGAEMSGQTVTWEVSELEGVTVSAAGVVSVAASAKTAVTDTTGTSVTVTATCGSASAETTVTVKRDTSVATTIELSGGSESVEVPVTDTAAVSSAFTPVVKDQYGSEMEAEVSWSITEKTGVSIAAGVVSVSKAAKEVITDTTGTALTVTAICGSANAETTVTVKRAASAATAIKVFKNGTELTADEDTAIVPTGDTPNVYTYTAALYDQYDAKMQDLTLAFAAGDSGAAFADMTGILTVSKSAVKDETCTLTAGYGELSDKVITVTMKDIEITAPVVTPAETGYGHTWAEIIPQSAIVGGSASVNGTNVEGTFYLKNEGTVIPDAGSQTYKIYFKSENSEYDVLALESSVTIARKNLSDTDVSVAEIEAVTYTGSAQEPEVTVTVGSVTLTEDTDYTAAYSANTDAGTATVTVTGIGNYTGSKAVNFTINKKPVAEADYSYDIPEDVTFDGTAKAVTAEKVTTGIGTLTVKYNGSTEAPVNAGEYTVTLVIADSDNYAGATVTLGTLTIAAKNVSDAVIGEIAAQTYTGSAITPAPAVTVGTTVLVVNTDYTVTYSSNTNAGTATVTVTGTGNYTGSKAANFTINKADVTAADLEYTIPQNAVYTAAAQPLNITGKTAGIGSLTVKYNGAAAAPLTVGTYAVTVEVAESVNYNAANLQLGNYVIARKNLSDNDVSIAEIAAVTYTGSAQQPEVTVTVGSVTLTEDTDYTAAYSANTNAGTATVTVTGIGNYTGSKAVNFTINKKPIAAGDYSCSIPTDIVYDGVEHAAAAAKVTSGIGTLTVKYNGSKEIPVKAGSYAVTLTIAESTNYEGKQNISIGTLEIAKKEAEISFGDTEFDYDGQEHSLIASVYNLCEDDVVAVSLKNGKQTEVGKYTAEVTALTGEDAENYLLPGSTVTCEYQIAHTLTDVTAAPETVSASIEGLTLVVTGYVKVSGETPESITITSGSIEESLTVTGDKLADGGTVTTTKGITYTVDTSKVFVNTTDADLTEKEPEVTIEQGVTGAAAIALQQVAAGTKEVKGLNDAVQSEAFKKAAEETEIKEIEVKLDIKLVDYQTDAGKTVLSLDLTPMILFKDEDGAPVGEEQVIEDSWLSNKVTISIQLPASMSVENLYAKHYLKSGTHSFEMIPVTVVDGIATWEQSSFSPVELFNDGRGGSITFEYADATQQTIDFTPENVNTQLPTDSKNGFDFVGWTIEGEDYTMLTDALLTAIDGQTVMATAKWTAVYVPVPVPVTTYQITAEAGENGTITPDGITKVNSGNKQTYTIKADEGYEIADVLVDGESVGAVKTYTFENVKADHKIQASFKKIQKEVVNPFRDVEESDYYYEAVLWAVDRKITKGITNTEFAPGNYCSRGQLVTFLWRAMGCPSAAAAVNPFTDVSAGDYYYEAVMWAVQNGITKGVTETEFKPGDVVSRAQAVTFLYRAANKPEVSGELAFADVEKNSYYYEAVLWAVGEKITDGMSAVSFGPADKCTRAHSVTFLYRYMEDK